MLMPETEFEAAYSQAFKEPVFSIEFTKKDLEREFDLVHHAINTALSTRWEQNSYGEKDFAISDEWCGARHHCGGIYSDRIIGTAYPQVISDALKSIPNGHLWTYHTAVEPQSGQYEFKWGGFFIRDGVLYASADDDEYDYKKNEGSLIRQRDNSSQVIHYLTAAMYHLGGNQDMIKRLEKVEEKAVTGADGELIAGDIITNRLLTPEEETLFLMWSGKKLDPLIKIQEEQIKSVVQARENIGK